MKDELTYTANPNYEAMYHKLCEEYERFRADHQALKRDYEAMESEFIRMRAQLDIVHLIFSK